MQVVINKYLPDLVSNGIVFLAYFFMEKNNLPGNKPQTGKEIKKDMPLKNPATDSIKNTATQTVGLNQEKTTRDDLFPSDGDNLTNI